MENAKPTKPYGGKILCANGHLVGMKDDERNVIKVRHHGREISVLCVPGVEVEVVCEKCNERTLVKFGPVEGSKRAKFTQLHLQCAKNHLH